MVNGVYALNAKMVIHIMLGGKLGSHLHMSFIILSSLFVLSGRKYYSIIALIFSFRELMLTGFSKNAATL